MANIRYVFLTITLCWYCFGMAQSHIGQFDSQTNIGNCKLAGNATYNSENQTYTISGAGKNMWLGRDEFQYLWTTLQGDFVLNAEVQFIGRGADPHRKAGWIVKNNLDDNSEHINAAVHGDGLTCLQYRNTPGGETEQLISSDSFPSVIQLERKGNTFTMSIAKFGQEFTSLTLNTQALNNDVYVGLYVCSHNANFVETAVFRNVRIVKPAPENFEAYSNYIGSHLEVMDIESGHRKILLSSAHSIQAPNWTIDGTKLIYNSKGRLFNYNLETNAVSTLNTGFAINNNNDHVLTFDGKTMGISHHSADNEGLSTIYYLPVEGDSAPVQVTKSGIGASYLHGWSPNNSTMIFTGHRNNQYDIYAVDVKTGNETRLTNFKTLDDGSEYSPDGKYIYFNSARTGKMKLWRMDPDGNNQTQLTFDEYNDWFPHVSPDMKWIVFLSYPKDIDPSSHPFYKHCMLRIMPYGGGEPKVLAYFYGGQGTINVPSWSPDSKRIAFVTNTDMNGVK